MDTVAHRDSVGDSAWSGLDAFIAQRHEKRVKEEGERPEEEMYAESCRRYWEQERRAKLWAEVRYREGMIRSHTATLGALVDDHRRALERALAMLGIDESETIEKGAA